MKEVSKEEIMKRMFEKVIRDVLLSMMKNEDFSFDYYSRKDQADVESKLDKAVKEVSEIFVQKLKTEGFIDKEPDEQTFKKLLKDSIEEYKEKNK